MKGTKRDLIKYRLMRARDTCEDAQILADRSRWNLMIMKIRVIKTEEDYNQALKRLEVIFDAPVDSREGDEAEILSILIEKYEDEHYPIEAPDPIEAIKFRMEQMDMNNQDLADIIGYKSRVSEIFNRKRKLTLKMIRNLHKKLKIPYESLIAD